MSKKNAANSNIVSFETVNNSTKESKMEKYEVVSVTEEDLIGKKELRDQYIDRLDILEKVKALFLIPEVNLMSTGMVAKFFDVPVDTIKSVYKNNSEEVDSDGVKRLKASEIFDGSMNDLSNFQRVPGGVITTCADGQKFQLTNRDSIYYTPRSIMRLAMLLRDSKVAQEVRTRILDTICKPGVKETIVKDIDDETKTLDALILDIIKNDDMTARLVSFTKYNDLKNGTIYQLESEKQEALDTIEVLLNGAREWGNSRTVNALIRKTAKVYMDRELKPYQYEKAAWTMWKELYKRLLYGNGIGLVMRNSEHPLKAVKEEEWPVVIRQAAALAEEYDVDIIKVIGELNAKKVS